MHFAVGGERGDAARAGFENQAVQPPLPPKLFGVLPAEGGELLLVAEIPGRSFQDVLRLWHLLVNVREHCVGGQQPAGRQYLGHLGLTIWAHRPDEGPTGKVGWNLWLPHIVDAVGAAEVDVAAMLLMSLPSIRRGVEDLQTSGIDRPSLEGVRDALGSVASDRSDDLHR